MEGDFEGAERFLAPLKIGLVSICQVEQWWQFGFKRMCAPNAFLMHQHDLDGCMLGSTSRLR
eukprot:874200-Pyramimonas_sp.AAC.1